MLQSMNKDTRMLFHKSGTLISVVDALKKYKTDGYHGNNAPCHELFDPADFKENSDLNFVKCPGCFGHGSGIYIIDAYGVDSHFKWHCTNCNGYGWVIKDSVDATCLNEFTEENVGRCLHEWTCKKCGKKQIVDSSD